MIRRSRHVLQENYPPVMLPISRTARARHKGAPFAAALLLLAAPPLPASDHADPVRIPMPWELLDDAKPKKADVKALTAGITDLFVFPVDENDRPISFPQADEKSAPFSAEERAKLGALTLAQRATILAAPRKARTQMLAAAAASDPAMASQPTREEMTRLERLTPRERSERQTLTAEQRARIKALVLILCVRRAIPADGAKLQLAPYTYEIHLDHTTPVTFDPPDGAPPEAATKVYSDRARYGGSIANPERIERKITFSFQLTDDATLARFEHAGLVDDAAKARVIHFPASDAAGPQSAIRDDPFIFPPFFRTNVVAMAAKVPIECFGDQHTWIVWAESKRGGKQIDHVGRSLRTQQPRFAQIFNDVEPKDQVAVFENARKNPAFLRDALVRLDIPALFNFRNWDAAPDVMIYNAAFDCRYPNGRLLTDDVASELAENGDTLLMELSYVGDTWPRRNENDKPFEAKFPYLAAPWTPAEVEKNPLPKNPPVLQDPVALSWQNKAIIVVGTLLLAGVLAGIGWVFGTWRCHRKYRDRYL